MPISLTTLLALTVDKSVRYETAMDRRLFRAIEELERQQSKRSGGARDAG